MRLELLGLGNGPTLRAFKESQQPAENLERSGRTSVNMKIDWYHWGDATSHGITAGEAAAVAGCFVLIGRYPLSRLSSSWLRRGADIIV